MERRLNTRARSRSGSRSRSRSPGRRRDEQPRSHDRRRRNEELDNDSRLDSKKNSLKSVRLSDKPRSRSRDRDREFHRERKVAHSDRVNEPQDNESQSSNISEILRKNTSRRDASNSVMQGREVWGNVAKEEEEEKAKIEPEIPEEEKQKANFGLSGALAKDERTGNMVNGVLLKFTEPLDAAQPTKKWRFYVFKDQEVIETLHIHRQSSFLFGKDDRVADILIAHPSCSRQHAVVQFRRIDKKDESGRIVKIVKPYIMDLGSGNKTFLNGSEIEDARYYELLEKDCVKFGLSSREYVLLHDGSA